MRLLIIDDDHDTVAMFKLLLEQMGHSVETCQFPEQCFDLALVFRPEVIFLDLLMPTMDGFEVIERLRANPELRDTPVVLFTGYPPERVQTHCRELGVEFVLKPASAAQLRSLLVSISNRQPA